MRLILIIILSFSISACAKQSESDIQFKQALNTSVQLIKLDEKIYQLINEDKPDALHHEIFVSTLVKLGTISDYAQATASDFYDPSQFDLGDINALCWAANYVIKYAKHENKFRSNTQSTIDALSQQQQKWVVRLKRDNSSKIFGESDCLKTIK